MAIWQPQNFSGYMYNHLYTPPTQLHTHFVDHTHTYRSTAHWIGNLQNMASWLASQDWTAVSCERTETRDLNHGHSVTRQSSRAPTIFSVCPQYLSSWFALCGWHSYIIKTMRKIPLGFPSVWQGTPILLLGVWSKCSIAIFSNVLSNIL